NPTIRPFRRELDDRVGNVYARVPLLAVSMDMPPNFEHFGVGAKLRCDALQFLVGFKVIAQFEPTLSRPQMQAVGMSQRIWVLVSHELPLTPIHWTPQGCRNIGRRFIQPIPAQDLLRGDSRSTPLLCKFRVQDRCLTSL